MAPLVNRLLHANTSGLDALVYLGAWAWLLFLTLVPDAAFQAVKVSPLLEVKLIWVWPSIIAVVVPLLGWWSGHYIILRLTRAYQVGYWSFIAIATILVAPTVLVFWLPAAGNVVAVLWMTAAEQAAHDGASSPAT